MCGYECACVIEPHRMPLLQNGPPLPHTQHPLPPLSLTLFLCCDHGAVIGGYHYSVKVRAALQHFLPCVVLQCVAVCCRVLECVAVRDSVLQPATLPPVNTLQHTATHCNTLQHTATRCNTSSRQLPTPPFLSFSLFLSLSLYKHFAGANLASDNGAAIFVLHFAPAKC